ncbi:MAG: T9SS type A sorting domain-containing protein [Flavobacteriales bacterium]|nr:T9SS type A sorting domain-containing protein [Flavobacteriales bacterium]
MAVIRTENQSEMKVRGKTAILAICLFVAATSSAQGTKQQFQNDGEGLIECGSDIIHQRMLIEDSDYRSAFERQSQILRESIRENSIDEQRMPVVHTVPIVVHIMHAGEAVGTGANISDEQILSAIDALNEDFRKMSGTNGDGNGVDVEIDFCLASRAPDGSPSNGINRIDASGLAFYANEGISIGQGSGANEIALKDLSRWDRDDYYNIWIVNEIEDNDGGAGIQGFAYFPSSSASRDGAVILYNAFGTVGNLKSYTSLNRTTTHELGHAFGLYHTFQGNSCSESNCATQGDEVCDTPPTISNTSCGNPACGGTQQVENYMDYTSETCMDMFTQGQKDRMQNALLTSRASLLNSSGCIPPNALDAGIVAVNEPNGYTCSTSFAPEVVLKNFGSDQITSVSIRYRIDGGSLETHNYNGSLAPGATETIVLASQTVSVGPHSFEVFSESPNGGTDGYAPNDSFSSDFEVVEGSSITVSIQVDNYGNETTWDIQDENGTVVASGGPYPGNANGTVFETDVCLSNDCFEFTIYDSYGDGICCGYGFGSYEVRDETGNTLVESGADFEDFETTPFCMAGSDSPPVADFIAQETMVCNNSTVQFFDLSSGDADTWSWSFPGGTPSSSTAQNPVVTYNTAGIKDVILTSTNAFGSDTETKTAYILVTSPATLTTITSDASCFNSSDGTIDLTLNGGVGPYTYEWNNGASSQDIAGLEEGTYFVLVTDAAGCTSSATATIDAPSAIDVSSTSSTDASCSNDGSATVNPSGGSSGYTYLWNDQQEQTSQTASDLASGTYTVIVTDSEGCQASTTIEVIGSGTIELSNGSKTHVTCYGASNGSATVNPSGGAEPYSYLWDNGQSTATATSLSGGTHLVTVIDANGCQASRTFFIQEPDELLVEVLSVTEESCPGTENGSISAEILGGTSPYSFNWNGAGLGQTLNPQGVSAGEYTISVTDDNNCDVDQNIVVSNGDPVEIALTVVNETCNESNNGSVSVSLSGGTPPYSYNWNGAGFGQTLNPQGIQAGTYTLNVADDNGCQAAQEFSVEEPEAITTSLVDISPDSCDLNVGRAEISVAGGTGQKTVQWDDPEQQMGDVLENVRFGIYTAEIADENNCMAFFTVEVEEVECAVTSVEEFTSTNLRIYPNPITGGHFNLEIGRNFYDIVNVSLIDITGKEVQHWTLNAVSGVELLEISNKITEGIYLIQMNDGHKTITNKIIIR